MCERERAGLARLPVCASHAGESGGVMTALGAWKDMLFFIRFLNEGEARN